MKPKITAGIHFKDFVNVVIDGRSATWWSTNADAHAAESGQGLERLPDGSIRVFDLPHEPTALELVEDRLDCGRVTLDWSMAQLCRAIRDAIRAGNHGGPSNE
jgi:hypothetical protein